MITYEEAKKIANEYVPGVDICREYATAWEFDRKDAPMRIGGMDGPVVIMKDTGKAVGLTWFLMHSDPKRYIDIEKDLIRESVVCSQSQIRIA